MAAMVVCWSGRDAGNITAREWGVVLATRRLLGRPLELKEMQLILDAERGVSL